MKLAKIDLPKRSGKRSKVREKSVKSQGILKTILSGNPGKADNEGKYVGTFAMASFNKKTFVITAKNVA